MHGQLDQLLPALAEARKKFKPIKKDGFNPHFKSNFATLKSIKEAVDEALAEHGLQIIQFPDGALFGKPGLATILAHTPSGQYIQRTTPLALTKEDPQAQGSAITYMRRYAYSAVLNLVTDDDDDGNAASVQERCQPQSRPAEKRQPERPPQVQAALGAVVAEAQRIGLTREATEHLFSQHFGETLDTWNVTKLKKFKEQLPQLVAQQELGAEVVE